MFGRKPIVIYLISIPHLLLGSSYHSKLVSDIQYCDSAKIQSLDICQADGSGPHPVAILIHGGGWGSGDKSGAEKPNSGADITPWFQHLHDAGFTWFSINYRLAPQCRWPACLDDTRSAIRWVKKHAAEYGGNPDKIVLFGHSAGGQLAFYSAIRSDKTTQVQAVVGYAPVTDLEQDLPIRGGLSIALQNLFDQPKEVTPASLELLRQASPVRFLKADMPPFLIVQGDADKTVPLEQSKQFQERAHETGNKCDLLIIPGGVHRLAKWSECDPDYQSKVTKWLKQTLSLE